MSMKKIIRRWKSALALLMAVCLLGAGLALPAAADSPYKLPDDLTVASPAAGGLSRPDAGAGHRAV